MDPFARPHDDLIYDMQESKRRLILFLGDADAILINAREVARKTEKQVDTLVRADAPQPHQEPHFCREQ
jgi:hypothetical protein